LFPDLSLEVVRAGESLYGLFESRYGVCMVRADERLRAVAADRVSAELLKVAEGSPLLLVERVTFTYAQKPVEWRRGFYSTRNHHYRNELG
jgi:GntR family transcriptional regulator